LCPSAEKIAQAFKYIVRKAYGETLYSVHNLRHAFAVRTYRATHDIYSVKQALGHANVSVTETYLRSLGLVEMRVLELTAGSQRVRCRSLGEGGFLEVYSRTAV